MTFYMWSYLLILKRNGTISDRFMLHRFVFSSAEDGW